jgi:general secretion pathway protein G
MLSLFPSGSVCRKDFVRRVAARPSNSVRCSLGFTLLELLTVIAIIGILAGLVIGGGRRANEASLAGRAKAELATLAVALEEYHRICGDYPQTSASPQLLQSLIGRRGPRNDVIAMRSLIEITRFSTGAAIDPFANDSAVLIDPWGQPYRYAYKSQMPWSNFSYVLYSLGPDSRDAPALLTGGWIDPAPTENADNLTAAHY